MRCLLLITVPRLVEARSPHWSREWAGQAGKEADKWADASRRDRQSQQVNAEVERGGVSRRGRRAECADASRRDRWSQQVRQVGGVGGAGRQQVNAERDREEDKDAICLL